jgi:23S rRNA pseudouridine2604 synthase
MNVKLDIEKGKWRSLNPNELSEIQELVGNSDKTHDQ